MKKCSLVFGLGLMFAILGTYSVSGQEYTHYATSDGYEFAVRVVPEKPIIMFGETTFLLFEVKNLSSEVLYFGDGGDYRNNLGRPESYRVSVVRDDGVPVSQPEVRMNMGGLSGVQHVPINGSYVKKLFLPHWATFETPGQYTITVTRTLSIRRRASLPTGPVENARSIGVTTSVGTTLKIVETDSGQMGELIRYLGSSILDRANDKRIRENISLLNSIHDERTIEYWIRVVEHYAQLTDITARFDLRRTPQMLAKYNTPEAFAALRAAANSKIDDVRSDVAYALGFLESEDALALLLSMRNDRDSLVRSRVVSALGKLNTDESTAMLIEMLSDPDRNIRLSAMLFLRERKKLPSELPLLPMSGTECWIRQNSIFKSMQTQSVTTSDKAGDTNVFSSEDCGKSLQAFLDELASTRRSKDEFTEAWILYQIGDIYSETRRFDDALKYYREALSLFRQMDADHRRSLLSTLGGVSESLRNYPQALEYLSEELLLVRTSENDSVRSDAWRILERIANVYFKSGDDKKGFEYLNQRLTFERQRNNEYGQFQALRALGAAYEHRGIEREAVRFYKEALDVAERLKGDWFRDYLEREMNDLNEAISRLRN